ncbi:hypothetical protein LUZ60_015570 [Juncus effusus]|nr:hypothetical protein LUZ60_015570 [Juncus effusus]
MIRDFFEGRPSKKEKIGMKTMLIVQMVLGRLLTQDNLIKRGWLNQGDCSMCTQHIEESANHLFLRCDFATQVWRRKGLYPNGATSIDDLWRTKEEGKEKEGQSAWGTEWLSTCWCIWKARNQLIFRQKRPFIDVVLLEIAQQTTNWRQYC